MKLLAHDLQLVARTEDIRCDEEVGFDIFNLRDDLLRGLNAIGFKRPSPVQLRAIPYGRCGVDMVVQSKSGTGKTCVFSVIALDNIDVSAGIQVLILTPTHEIAQQGSEVLQALGRKIQNLVVATCIGGHHHDEKKKLKSCQIVIGSPGRVKYLIEKSKLCLQSVRLFVLDEADFLVGQEKMRADVNWICSALPDGRQTIALSATFSTQLSEYVTNYMNSPVHIKMSPTTAVLLGVRQFFHHVNSFKFDGSYSHAKYNAVKEILEAVTFKQCIIFYNNYEKADALLSELSEWKSEWSFAFISSQLEPAKRSAAFTKFRQSKCQVLISSDLICRGADAKDVDLVLHLDFPRSVDTYLHRVGRAGRFGGFGVSIAIVALSQEFDLIQKYEERLKIDIPELPYPPSRDLITSCEVKLPSCRVGDIVTADKIDTTAGLVTTKTVLPSQPKPSASDESQASNRTFDDKVPCTEGYGDMLASYEEVDKFLNLENSVLASASNNSTSSKLESAVPISILPSHESSLNSVTPDKSTDQTGSESSQLARNYYSSFSKGTPSLESLMKSYKPADKINQFSSSSATENEPRSDSAATFTGNKEEEAIAATTPTPTVIKSNVVKPSNRNRAKRACDKFTQTEKTQSAKFIQTANDNEFDQKDSFGNLHYIPMPPLMSAGGYSEFAEWLQLHGSLIYKPEVRQSSCQCSCHCSG